MKRALLTVPLLLLMGLCPPRAVSGQEPADTTDFSDFAELSLEDILQVEVVTSTKTKQVIREAPSIISVITRRQIKQRNFRSVAEAVSSLPGVFVNYDYVFYDMGLRGISGELRGGSRMVKVMINGQAVSFRSETTNWIGPELVPIEAVERIEVIRGPGSALYGANAFLGVVNVITRTGAQLNGSRITLNGSLFDQAYGGVGLDLAVGVKPTPFLDVLLAISLEQSERSGRKIHCTTQIGGEAPCSNLTAVTESILSRKSFHDVTKPSTFLATADVDLEKVTGARLGRVRVQGNLQLLDSRGSFSDWGTLIQTELRDVNGNSIGLDPNSGNRLGLYNGVLNGEYQVSFFDGRIDLQVGGSYAQGGTTDSEHLAEVTGVLQRPRYGFTGIDGRIELRFELIRNHEHDGAAADQRSWGGIVNSLSLLTGADLIRNDVTYISESWLTGLSYRTSSLRNLGAWGQLTGSFLGGAVGLIAGARYDSHLGAELSSDTIQALQPEQQDRLCENHVCYDNLNLRFGGTFSVLRNVSPIEGEKGCMLDDLFVKLLWGTSFKAPEPSFLYNAEDLGERPLNPNPGLLPQELRSFEIQLGSVLLARKLSLSANFFYNQLRNKTEFSRIGMAVAAANGAQVNTWGIEGEVLLRYALFEGYATLSFQSSERQLGENSQQRITDTFGYPSLTAVVGGTLNFENLGLFVNLEYRYTGERVGHPFNRSDLISERYTLAPYHLVDLNISFTGWSLVKKRETRIALRVRNLLDSQYDFPGFQPYYRYDIPGLPRTIMLTLSQEF